MLTMARNRSLPLDLPGHLKKIYMKRKGGISCKNCRSTSFDKFAHGTKTNRYLHCISIICKLCGARSVLLLDEKLCANCPERIDCLAEEVELVTQEIICLMI